MTATGSEFVKLFLEIKYSGTDGLSRIQTGKQNQNNQNLFARLLGAGYLSHRRLLKTITYKLNQYKPKFTK